MIDGMWWVVILVGVVGALWLLAHLRGDKSRSPILNKDRDHKTKSNQKHPHKTSANTAPNSALQKTAELLRQHFPKYHVTLKNNHLLLSKQNKKIELNEALASLIKLDPSSEENLASELSRFGEQVDGSCDAQASNSNMPKDFGSSLLKSFDSAILGTSK